MARTVYHVASKLGGPPVDRPGALGDNDLVAIADHLTGKRKPPEGRPGVFSGCMSGASVSVLDQEPRSIQFSCFPVPRPAECRRVRSSE
jgi:hypothetical protein